MSAIRLRSDRMGIEVRLDDDTPISDEPVSISVPGGFRVLTITQALELANAISTAALEALQHTIAERCDGRVQHWHPGAPDDVPEYHLTPRRAPK